MASETNRWQRFLASEKERVETTLNEQQMQRNEPLRRRKAHIKRSDFYFCQVLGKGGFGEVHLLRCKTTKTWHAAKILLKSAVINKGYVNHVNNELKVLKLCNMPFIVHFNFAFQDAIHLFLVMEFVPGGDLFTLLRRDKHFDEPLARFLSGQVLLGLEYLHSLTIIHRDIKPENIMITHNGYLKLVDFGFAKFVKLRTYTFCGTPEYLAPEILLHRGYSFSVDWWAFGILLFELVHGMSPFVCQNVQQTYAKILEAKVTFPPGISISKDLKHLIVNLLQRHVSKRFGSLREGPLEIRNHAWFAEQDWYQLFQQNITHPYGFSILNSTLGEGVKISKQQIVNEYFENF